MSGANVEGARKRAHGWPTTKDHENLRCYSTPVILYRFAGVKTCPMPPVFNTIIILLILHVSDSAKLSTCSQVYVTCVCV